MIAITKKTMEALIKEYGLEFGENGISRTYGHNHHYYLCESYKNLDKLRKYYNKIGASTEEIDRLHSIKRR